MAPYASRVSCWTTQSAQECATEGSANIDGREDVFGLSSVPLGSTMKLGVAFLPKDSCYDPPSCGSHAVLTCAAAGVHTRRGLRRILP